MGKLRLREAKNTVRVTQLVGGRAGMLPVCLSRDPCSFFDLFSAFWGSQFLVENGVLCGDIKLEIFEPKVTLRVTQYTK